MASSLAQPAGNTASMQLTEERHSKRKGEENDNRIKRTKTKTRVVLQMADLAAVSD
jgi:hypothetical protein